MRDLPHFFAIGFCEIKLRIKNAVNTISSTQRFRGHKQSLFCKLAWCESRHKVMYTNLHGFVHGKGYEL